MTSLIQTWVSTQAQTRPEAVAIVFKDQKLTYGELDAFSNQLARRLKLAGCRKGDRVALLVPKTPMAIVAIVGIYKADCVYVPLDPSNPAERLSKAFLSSMSRCVLGSIATVNEVRELLANDKVPVSTVAGWLDTTFAYKKVLGPEFSMSDIFDCSDQPLDYKNSENDTAHILFTSGSTGTPKGVVITHANVIAFVEWARQYFRMDSSDRISGQVPLCFDLSIFDIFGTFAAGAELHLVPPEVNLLPHRLADWIRSSRLTQWFSVPSVLNYMAKFNVVKQQDFPHLKRVLWCGEVFPVPALRYWMQRLPGTQFTNLYGPTETTIASSYYTLPACPELDTAVIPIGTACAGEELLVLDKQLHKVPAGVTGDLYIGGRGLSPGYWCDPDKTSEAFVQNPYSTDPLDRIYRTGDLARAGKDDLVYFAGREDTQIKSRGYRIELGEIESAFNTIKELRECAVVAIETSNFEGSSVCCAYVPCQENGITSAQLREKLSGIIPLYMLPSQWMPFKVLPKNANGKIDRGQLKETFLSHASL